MLASILSSSEWIIAKTGNIYKLLKKSALESQFPVDENKICGVPQDLVSIALSIPFHSKNENQQSLILKALFDNIKSFEEEEMEPMEFFMKFMYPEIFKHIEDMYPDIDFENVRNFVAAKVWARNPSALTASEVFELIENEIEDSIRSSEEADEANRLARFFAGDSD